MRNQSNRRKQIVNEETSYHESWGQEINQPQLPSWDSEELDLSAGYQRVDTFIPIYYLGKMHKIKD